MKNLISKFTDKYGKQSVVLVEHYLYTAVGAGAYAFQHNNHDVRKSLSVLGYALFAPVISYLNPRSASNKAKIAALIKKAVDQALAKAVGNNVTINNSVTTS
jgi:DNA-binding LacI/PurR family transcriptional regulator